MYPTLIFIFYSPFQFPNTYFFVMARLLSHRRSFHACALKILLRNLRLFLRTFEKLCFSESYYPRVIEIKPDISVNLTWNQTFPTNDALSRVLMIGSAENPYA